MTSACNHSCYCPVFLTQSPQSPLMWGLSFWARTYLHSGGLQLCVLVVNLCKLEMSEPKYRYQRPPPPRSEGVDATQVYWFWACWSNTAKPVNTSYLTEVLNRKRIKDGTGDRYQSNPVYMLPSQYWNHHITQQSHPPPPPRCIRASPATTFHWHLQEGNGDKTGDKTLRLSQMCVSVRDFFVCLC